MRKTAIKQSGKIPAQPGPREVASVRPEFLPTRNRSSPGPVPAPTPASVPPYGSGTRVPTTLRVMPPSGSSFGRGPMRPRGRAI